MIRPEVPQILINREPLSHMSFDVELYGNCDDVIAELCTQLGSEWTNILQGFKQSTLDHERWKMFYDYCNSSVTSADENDDIIIQRGSDVISPNIDNKQSSAETDNKDSSNCKCGTPSNTADNIDNGTVGSKRKSPTCSPANEKGPSPNKKTKSNIHMDSEQGKHH